MTPLAMATDAVIGPNPRMRAVFEYIERVGPGRGTVLVTGGSGFIASHCILQLLAAGHQVRTTVRNLRRAGEVRAMLKQGGAGEASNRLAFIAADLQADADWPEAAAGCDQVLHVASPFPVGVPRHEDELIVPTRANDGIGYAGDIAAVVNGGFAVSSNQAGLAQPWHPGKPEELTSIVKLKESYALASWPGAGDAGGLLVATAFGLVRWLPAEKAAFLPWPQPMALDNHWVLMA